MFATPPKRDFYDGQDDEDNFMPAGTPAPHRARVNNLTNQVSELVRSNQHLEKRHKADLSRFNNEMDQMKKEMDKYKTEAKQRERELVRCKAEGDGMREELNLYSAVQQQKAVLALAQEQMQIIELERRLVQAEAERIMRDHRISLFQAREAEVIAEMEEKDLRLEDLETQLTKSRTTDSKSRGVLEAKVEKLETKVQTMVSTEKELRQELESLLKSEKSTENSSDKEKRQLQVALKAAKSELASKIEELSDAQEELVNYKESSKEREKTLKQKLKEVTMEKDRLAGLEDELDAMKTSSRIRSASQSVQPEERATPKRQKTAVVKPKEKAKMQEAIAEEASDVEEPVVEKPKKKAVEKAPVAEKKLKENKPIAPRVTVRKATPIDEESDDGGAYDAPAPKKKARTPARSVSPQPPVKASKPLGETSDNIATEYNSKMGTPYKVVKPLIVKKKSKPTLVDEDDAQPEKKKKRKLLGVQPAFQWDSIMNSGDGVIPSTLSPLKPTTAKTGSIPRAGFPSSASSRGLSRFQ